MQISDQTYLNWQKKITDNNRLRNFWAFLGIYSILFYFIAGGYFAIAHRNFKIVVATGVATLFTRYVVCEIFHAFYKKSHPYQRLDFKPPKSILFSFLDNKPDSLPSEHASASMAINAVFFVFSPALGIAGFFVSILIGMARIILGYHEVSDVAAGWVVGLLSGLFVLYLGQRFW